MVDFWVQLKEQASGGLLGVGFLYTIVAYVSCMKKFLMRGSFWFLTTSCCLFFSFLSLPVSLIPAVSLLSFLFSCWSFLFHIFMFFSICGFLFSIAWGFSSLLWLWGLAVGMKVHLALFTINRNRNSAKLLSVNLLFGFGSAIFALVGDKNSEKEHLKMYRSARVARTGQIEEKMIGNRRVNH